MFAVIFACPTVRVYLNPLKFLRIYFHALLFCELGTLPVIRSPSVLEWSFVNRLFPWHLIFLLGGGFAIASGAVVSGASDWFAEKMEGFEDFPKTGVLLITYTITMIFTNFMSNMAICNIMLPILLELVRHKLSVESFITNCSQIASVSGFDHEDSSPVSNAAEWTS